MSSVAQWSYWRAPRSFGAQLPPKTHFSAFGRLRDQQPGNILSEPGLGMSLAKPLFFSARDSRVSGTSKYKATHPRPIDVRTSPSALHPLKPRQFSKTSTFAKVISMGIFTVVFSTQGESEQHSFQRADDVTLLDAAEQAGFDWPYSSRSGSDSTSAARLTSGKVDLSEQSFLDDGQVAAGFILTDVAYPRSDCVLVLGVEGELF
ncbi:hypothetical protein Purlil1_13155 [Purpureocillium lilacinum]|uniref:Ferredoxin n=1 Tax=Purpureocillium lilacinum TaxID=33203 RepID=A0ABR0BET8_PURLI|nr:hypothetical protein Purlil1_13155 [Purpureocillium lilacinum]